MKAEDLKIRCSSLNDIMSGVAKGWTVADSLTCKQKLIFLWREARYKRSPRLKNKWVSHGIENENAALTLYSVVKGVICHKNEERLSNDFITGEVDSYIGKDILNAKRVIDTKASYSLDTFPTAFSKINPDYADQVQGYCWLTGADDAVIASCLANHTQDDIQQQKNKLRYKYNFIDIEPQEYIDECLEIERNCIFDMELFRKVNPYCELYHRLSKEYMGENPIWEFDIPAEERVLEQIVKRDEVRIEQFKTRIIECHEFIKENPTIFLGQND